MDDRSLNDCVVLTSSTEAGTISARQQSKPLSVAHGLLIPLRKGKPVVLEVEDSKLPKRKRAETPKLFLTPMTVYGRPSRKIVAAMETYGCEVLDTSTAIRPVSFIRLGLRMELARALANELNLLFNLSEGETNGKR